jgi:hypothetical protein
MSRRGMTIGELVTELVELKQLDAVVEVHTEVWLEQDEDGRSGHCVEKLSVHHVRSEHGKVVLEAGE